MNRLPVILLSLASVGCPYQWQKPPNISEQQAKRDEIMCSDHGSTAVGMGFGGMMISSGVARNYYEDCMESLGYVDRDPTPAEKRAQDAEDAAREAAEDAEESRLAGGSYPPITLPPKYRTKPSEPNAPDSAKPLTGYTDDQLLDELVKRRDARRAVPSHDSPSAAP